MAWHTTAAGQADYQTAETYDVNCELDFEANDLGVVLDSQLLVPSHIAATCRSCFYQMRQLRFIRRLLSADAMCVLVQVFDHCRLDDCNSLLTGAADVHFFFKRLQSVQNAAVRLFSGARHCGHITPLLCHSTGCQ